MAQPHVGYGNTAEKGQSHALHRPTRDQVLPLYGIRLSSPHQPPLAKLHEAPSARPLEYRTCAKGADAGGGGGGIMNRSPYRGISAKEAKLLYIQANQALRSANGPDELFD